MTDNLVDLKILRLLKKDTNTGMDLMVETYGNLAAYIIRRKISSVCGECDVEECTAQTFIDLYAQLDRIDLSKGSLKGYISLIARRRAADRFNSAVRDQRRMTELDEVYFGDLPDSALTPEAAAMQKETGNILLNEVNKLGKPDSEILFRRYYLEQSLNEIAEAIGMNRPAVSKRIERALGKLKVTMEGLI